MASFFSRSGLELLKERTVQRVQEQLEQVGVHNEYIEKRAKRLGGDQELCEFMDLATQVHDSLEGVIKAATIFHKGVCVLQESGRQLRGGPKDPIRKYTAVVREAPTLETTYDQDSLRSELQSNVTIPIRAKMRELADIRNRIKEAAIVHLEADSRKENVERLRTRQASPVVVGQAEDLFAEKQVEFERARVRLMDEYALLQRDHESIFQKAFNSFKLCQYRFLMNASATLGTITDENEEGLASSGMSASLRPSPASPADFDHPPPTQTAQDANADASSNVVLEEAYELDLTPTEKRDTLTGAKDTKEQASDETQGGMDSKEAHDEALSREATSAVTLDSQEREDANKKDDDDEEEEEETATL
ncbi:Hypothetical Protein FCC1311_081122 [Hondaea fermentalgiana]|uniref:BAR domain-containing protein n=1 Tax=Hondaea fermentalgiana TaxID=2315210 RepID=A0A2R5GLY0_9STRA|nr:Hypothetical Protein FCC1311_081122 [Hondaea fermentalgiana]|eukprot:GBG31887.1 Hypothetical Protein FCC1311_081122 [Hondaea fermentalgiana]